MGVNPCPFWGIYTSQGSLDTWSHAVTDREKKTHPPFRDFLLWHWPAPQQIEILANTMIEIDL
jgi:hypothetical protein